VKELATAVPDNEILPHGYDAEVAKKAMKIHSLEAAEKAAGRAKNIEALESALVYKLEAQRDFGAVYRAIYPAPKLGLASNDSTVVTPSDFCSGYGFHIRSVQRWCERLLDEAKFEAEKNKIVKRCKELAEMWQSASFSLESAAK
jgi:hypothetical protein